MGDNMNEFEVMKQCLENAKIKATEKKVYTDKYKEVNSKVAEFMIKGETPVYDESQNGRGPFWRLIPNETPGPSNSKTRLDFFDLLLNELRKQDLTAFQCEELYTNYFMRNSKREIVLKCYESLQGKRYTVEELLRWVRKEI